MGVLPKHRRPWCVRISSDFFRDSSRSAFNSASEP
jgi:hypothetical protein